MIKIYKKDFHTYVQTLPKEFTNLYVFDWPYEINYNNSKDYDDTPGQIDHGLLFSECFRSLTPSGNLIFFQGWTKIIEILNTLSFYRMWEIRDWIIWDRIKGSGAYNSPRLISTREDIIVLGKKGHKATTGRTNRILTNVWYDISPLMYTTKEWHAGRGKDGKGYTGPKPVELMQRLIDVYSNPGDLIIDGFCGSGSTAVAAQRAGRDCICTDVNPEAIQIAKKRVRLGI
jgi:DNA modification methylase